MPVSHTARRHALGDDTLVIFYELVYPARRCDRSGLKTRGNGAYPHCATSYAFSRVGMITCIYIWYRSTHGVNERCDGASRFFGQVGAPSACRARHQDEKTKKRFSRKLPLDS